MSDSTNPYIVGKVVPDSDAFIKRDQLLNNIMQDLHDSKNNAIVLYGQRRIGKTLILQYLEAQLPNLGNYCPVYFQFLMYQSDSASFDEIIKNLRQTIINKLEEFNFSTDLETDFKRWLFEVSHKLKKKTLVLLLDEFDVLTTSVGGKKFISCLCELLKDLPHFLKCVCVIGRYITDIDPIVSCLFRDPKTKQQQISLLNQEEAKELVLLSEKNNTLKWQDMAVKQVWQYTHGHPFFTQLLCSKVYEKVHNKKQKSVVFSDVKDAVSDVLQGENNILPGLWNHLSFDEQIVATILATTVPKPMTQQSLEDSLKREKIPWTIQKLQDTLSFLLKRDLLEVHKDGYCFRFELLGYWIHDNYPLEKIVDHQTCKDDVTQLIEAGNVCLRNENINDAISNFRQAIELRPSDVETYINVAEILQKNELLEKAKEVLTQLYTYNKPAAKFRLVKVLPKLIENAKDEEQRLEYYQNIIDYDLNGTTIQELRKEAEKKLAAAKLKKEEKLEAEKKLAAAKLKKEEKLKAEEKTKKLQRRRRIIGVVLIILVIGGYWKNIGKEPEQIVLPPSSNEPEHIVQLKNLLKQTNDEIEALQELGETESFEQYKKITNRESKRMLILNKLKQAQQSRQPTGSEVTELEKFMLQLEYGDNVVIVKSSSPVDSQNSLLKAQEKIQKELGDIKKQYSGLYPYSFEHKEMYFDGKAWAIYIGGFYSYSSAQRLKEKAEELGFKKYQPFIKNPLPPRN